MEKILKITEQSATSGKITEYEILESEYIAKAHAAIDSTYEIVNLENLIDQYGDEDEIPEDLLQAAKEFGTVGIVEVCGSMPGYMPANEMPDILDWADEVNGHDNPIFNRTVING